jgi:sec-independent protein translocase protein TatA
MIDNSTTLTSIRGDPVMGTFSIWHWLVVLVVVLILFGGGGKLSRLMGDMAKGVNAFKKGLKDKDGEEVADPQQKLDSDRVAATGEASKKDEAVKG